ncbi:MAG: papain-like cysteine protease family protein, partial [Hyphomicrobium sp.]
LIWWKMEKFKMSFANLVPPELDAECLRIRDANVGISNPRIMTMAKRLGLIAVPPMSPTTDCIAQWLRQYGPLWVNGKSHIVVIAGIRGMDVKVYDPLPVKVGKIDWRSLDTWYVGGSISSRDTSVGAQTVFLHCP